MTVLHDYLKYHLPSKEAAKEHIRLTIKYYSQLGEYKFKRQLEIAERGLYVSGFTREQAKEIIKEVTTEEEK